MVRTIHYCTFCEYKSDRKYDRDKHVTKKHGIDPSIVGKYQPSLKERAPTSTLQPKVVYSSTENRQHLTGYQVPNQGLPVYYQNGSGVSYIKHPSKANTRVGLVSKFCGLTF